MTAEETWRLFVAVHPPADALAELAAVVDGVRDATPPGLRWSPPELWHVTVAFLGAVPVAALAAVEAELAHVARRHAPAHVRIAGAGRFGDRVLWAALHDADADGGRAGLRALRALAGATVRRIGKAGIPVDAGAFKAHLTLARSRGGADLHPVIARLRDFSGRPWTAGELTLVRSRLGAGPEGRPAYETVGAWPIGPDGPLPHQYGPVEPGDG